MNLPGVPMHRFKPRDDDDARRWMLGLVDASPDKLAFIAIPHAATDAELDAEQEWFDRVYESAKAERPDLGVKLLYGVDVGNGRGRSHAIVVLHEHRWVGGRCVNGCPDTREAP